MRVVYIVFNVVILVGFTSCTSIGSKRTISSIDDATVSKYRKEYDEIKARSLKLSELSGTNINPQHFKDQIARRFINRANWEDYLNSGTKNIKPEEVYSPKPQTWNKWFYTNENLVMKAANDNLPLSTEMIFSWNKKSLEDTIPKWIKTGGFKTSTNFQGITNMKSALSANEIQNLTETTYFNTDKKIVKWEPIVCEESLPPKNKIDLKRAECILAKKIIDHNSNDSFFAEAKTLFEKDVLSSNGPAASYLAACWPRVNKDEFMKNGKQCGIIFYPEKEKVIEHFNEIITDINNYFIGKSIKQNLDPIAYALYMQKMYVSMHPFNDGNGRTSRWLMDYITTKAGLPPITIKDMDTDMTTDFETYLKQGYEGVEESIKIMNSCLDQWEKYYENQNVTMIDAEFSNLQKSKCGFVKVPDVYINDEGKN